MILYNVTVKIAKAVHDDWLEWMKTVHIPDVLKTNLFGTHFWEWDPIFGPHFLIS